jgi:hypothetical protein
MWPTPTINVTKIEKALVFKKSFEHATKKNSHTFFNIYKEFSYTCDHEKRKHKFYSYIIGLWKLYMQV